MLFTSFRRNFDEDIEFLPYDIKHTAGHIHRDSFEPKDTIVLTLNRLTDNVEFKIHHDDEYETRVSAISDFDLYLHY